MSNMLLRDSDAVAMKSSLEARFPLIDRRIVEFSLQIPFEYQIQDSTSLGGRNYSKNGLKRILRVRLSTNYHQIYSITINVFNCNQYLVKKPLAGLLENTFNQPSEIFEPKEITKHYNQWRKDNSHWKKVWSIFILDQWYKNVFKLN
ncbi:MAG: hypothetical protein IPN76_10395 [Saprospiraceae bacterium]|nr:hypothetical protein [Saprospiraceae bacterium]